MLVVLRCLFAIATQSLGLTSGSYLCMRGVRGILSHTQLEKGLHGQRRKAVAAICRAWRFRYAFAAAAGMGPGQWEVARAVASLHTHLL